MVSTLFSLQHGHRSICWYPQFASVQCDTFLDFFTWLNFFYASLGCKIPLDLICFHRIGFRPESINTNRKIMITTIRDPDLLRIENWFTYDIYTKRLGINLLFKRCGINPALRFLVLPITMTKLILDPE
jgi:hypothetical protein